MQTDVRLIDANELMKKIAHHTVHDSLKHITFEAANTYEKVKGDMFSLVQKAPVVDAVPAVCGRWDEDSVFLCNVCMVCGAVVERHCVKDKGKMNYCPNCGAKMDLKEDEHDHQSI